MVWCVRSDPCGLFSANLTLLLLIYSQCVIVWVVLLPWYGWHWHVYLYSTFTVLAVVSHCRAQYTNPGTLPKDHSLLSSGVPLVFPRDYSRDNDRALPTYCKKCNTIKPPGTHHCSSCGRCIMRMDHHCPWVNNCVAIFNQKYFILFLFYTMILCFYAGGLLVGRFVSCTANIRKCPVRSAGVALTIINFVEAVVFGLFVIIMLYDQISAIVENTPGIDALQDRYGQRKPFMEMLNAVFGEKFSWRWFVPLNLPKRVKEDFDKEVEEAVTLLKEAAQVASSNNNNEMQPMESMQGDQQHQHQQPLQPRHHHTAVHADDDDQPDDGYADFTD